MAKKKKRKYYRNHIYVARTGKNRHHLLWMRRNWAKGVWSNKLRNHPAMTMMVDANLHILLHERVNPIPVPSESACRHTYEQLTYLWEYGALNEDSSLETRISVLTCCLAYVADSTVDALLHQYEVASKLGIL